MTVDLSKAVKGSKVFFRCGGEAVVDKIVKTDQGYNTVWVDFEGYNSQQFWVEGESYGSPKPSPIDIIRIEPPAFDWATVKPGMAFKDNWIETESIWIYAYKISENYVFANPELLDKPHTERSHMGWTSPYGRLIRAPEHDIEVKS